MNRVGKLVVLGLLAVLMVAAGLYFAFGKRDLPLDAPLASAHDVAAKQGPLSADLPATSRSAPVSSAAARVAMDASGGTGKDLDPAIRAALCGFKGRVLGQDRAPAKDLKVQILRFSIESVINEGVLPMSERAMEPEIEGGEGKTGEDGRFLISGVWPRAVYMLVAGVGSESPTWQVIERTPGPGEVVDLGDIVLRAVGIVVGHVVGDDGKPIAGALVRAVDLPAQVLTFVPLERFDPEGVILVRGGSQRRVVEMPAWVKQRFAQLPVASTRSAEDGAFRLTGVEPGSNVVLVTAPAHVTHVDPKVMVKAGEEKDVGSIKLGEGETAEGRVIDAAGKPVAHAEVVLAPTSPMAPMDFAGKPMHADDQGRFSLTGLPSGQVTGAARRSASQPWVMAEPQVIDKDLVIQLPSTWSLTVHLRSKAGRPIVEPKLQLLPQSGDRDMEAVGMMMMGFAAHLDVQSHIERLEDGSLRIGDLAAGKYLLLATSQNHAVASTKIELLGNLEQTISLDEQQVFRVLVQDGSGHAIAQAAIYATPNGEQRLHDMPILCGHTAADGSLRVTQIAAPKVEIVATHPAYGSVEKTVALPAGEVHLEMDAPGFLDGTLTEKGQAPEIGKWTISLTSRNGDRSGFTMPSLAVPDAEGKFRITGLQPGEHSVTPMKSLRALSTPGGFFGFMQGAMFQMDAMSKTVHIVAGQRTVMALDTAERATVDGPSANLSGTVFVNGRPGAGMVVTGWANRRLVAEVDAGGRFDLGQVPQGSIWLQLQDPKRAGRQEAMFQDGALWSRSVQVKANEDQTVVIEVQTGGLSGIVLGIDGAPAVGCEVHANLADAKNGGNSYQSTITDERGRFAFDVLSQGTWNVQGKHAKQGRGTAQGVRVTTGAMTSGVEIRLQRAFKVSGKVDLAPLGEKHDWVWANFHRVPDAEGGVAMTGASEGTNVGNDGSFSVDGLPSGTYEVDLYSSAGQWVHDGKIVVENGDLSGVELRPVRKPQPAEKKGGEKK